MFFGLDGFLEIILCAFYGSLLHESKLGINKAFYIASSMIVLGNLLLTVSTIQALFPLALIARMISGIGMEL